MPIAASMLPEFDHEMQSTRATLERVPTDHFDWKPHEKSGSAGWMAGHLANLPLWTVVTVNQDELDMGAPGFQLETPTTTEEVLALFDKNVALAREALEGASDETLMSNWTLRTGDQVHFAMPKVAVLRSFVMNHIIHHRGQLTVYLRLNDIPVPALYGPSADEGTM